MSAEFTSANAPQPTKLEAHGGSTSHILVQWTTGQRFSLAYKDLRFECPCAGCVDEHTGQRTIQREQVAQDVKVDGAEVVGRYAIQFKFSDGHGTGIYPFEKLYQICERSGADL